MSETRNTMNNEAVTGNYYLQKIYFQRILAIRD